MNSMFEFEEQYLCRIAKKQICGLSCRYNGVRLFFSMVGEVIHKQP